MFSLVFVRSRHATLFVFCLLCVTRLFSRAGIDSNWSNKRLHVDEGVGMVSLPGQHPPATSSLGGGSNPNPTRGGGSGGGGGGAGGESGSSTAVAAGSSSSANVAAS